MKNKHITMERLIKVTFSGGMEQIQDSYDTLTIYDKDRVATLEVRTSYECYIHENYICFLLLSDSNKEIYNNVLESNNITYICEDISNEVIDNSYDIFTIINNHNSDTDHYDYFYFYEEVTSWVYENLSVNLILDRINSYGMDNLRTIDYEFLDCNTQT